MNIPISKCTISYYPDNQEYNYFIYAKYEDQSYETNHKLGFGKLVSNTLQYYLDPKTILYLSI